MDLAKGLNPEFGGEWRIHFDGAGVMTKTHRLRFWVLLLLGLLVLLPVVLVSAILLALRSETGTAWVIDQIPGLEAVNDHGSLFGTWQADRLEWRGYGVDVAVESPLVDWSPSCLLICNSALKPYT